MTFARALLDRSIGETGWAGSSLRLFVWAWVIGFMVTLLLLG